MKPKLFLLLTIFLFIGCASNGAERKPMRSKNFISQEEIKELTVARTAKDAIEIARPTWLRGRGIDPSVFMNGMLMGDLDQLGNISINSVKEIKFGPRRAIEKIEIAVEGKETLKYDTLSKDQIKSSDKDVILGHILNANLFPLIRQRPFNKVPDPNIEPRDIFISGYNSAPLAVDLHPILERNKEAFQLGLTALSKLTAGEVFLTLKEAIDFEDVQVQTIAGPHPAGNVGIQIHHIKPLKQNEVIWIMNAQHVITLGRLFESGIYDPKIIVSIGGSGADKPDFAKALMGTKIESFLDNQSSNKPVRIISGDVLTGHTVERHDFIRFYDSSITIIDDKVDRPFLGMLSIGNSKTKYSLTNTFLTLTNPLFNFTTAQNGEKRAMVPINAWENVLPMDILPNPLYRAVPYGKF